MNPLVLSAQHAAYTWYLNEHPGAGEDYNQARRFARNEWTTFLSVANEGWGRLLLRVANGRQKLRTRQRRLSKLGA
jgi:hypothetical protein